ncbi:MAG: hypothetical protein QM758_07135 [Armatimonas sp.]
MIVRKFAVAVKLLFGLLAVACFFLPARSMAQGYVFEAAFQQQTETNPLILIQVAVNGSQPAWFVFSTSSDLALVLNENYKGITVKETGESLKVDGSIALKKLESAKIAVKASPADLEANVQNAYRGPLKNLDDFYGKGKIAGIIGGDITHFFKIAIDFDAAKIKFGINSTLEDMNFKGLAKAQKLKLEQGMVSNIAPVVKIRTEKEKDYFGVIDTSIANSQFTEGLMKTYAIKKSKLPEVAPDLALFDVTDFQLAGKKQAVIAYQVPDAGRTSLGLGFLKNFNILLDYKNQELYLAPREVSLKQSGSSGFTVVEKDGKFVVDNVSKEFSGSEAIQAGDEIVVEGELTLQQVLTKLDGSVGQEQELKVRRKGEVKTLKYKPISLF